MIGMTNAGGSGTGCTLTITAPAGAAITVSNMAGKVKSKTVGANGLVVFRGLTEGTWEITITNGTDTATKTVEIKANYNAKIDFNTIPEFTYTGEYEIVNDSDEVVESSPDNWKIRLLTSGTLVFSVLNGAENGVDVFLVGGGGGGGKSATNFTGGGGGGAGYTKTQKGVSVAIAAQYNIVIGAGGGPAINGGDTTAFGATANGGKAGSGKNAGAGGSAGGGGGYSNKAAGNGGSDGESTEKADQGGEGATGQGTTTCEFADVTGKMYAGGGGGGASVSNGGAKGTPGTGGIGGGGNGSQADVGGNATANTGGGGGGGGSPAATTHKNGGSGGSGIVIIRNAREVA